MKFISLASSSRGNAYLLKSPGVGQLLLEAGLPVNVIREKLRDRGVSLSDLAGCLVSHEHGDHSRAVKDLLRAGVDCYMSGGTAKGLGVADHYRTHSYRAIWYIPDSSTPDRWIVSTFFLEHDATEPIGFIIDHQDDRLLFMPDTAAIQNLFEGITIVAVECNYIAEMLNNSVLEGHIPAVVGKRIRDNHMSLESLIAMLKSSDLSRCRVIYLLHLSSGNSSEEIMKRKVQETTGIPTYICEEG